MMELHDRREWLGRIALGTGAVLAGLGGAVRPGTGDGHDSASCRVIMQSRGGRCMTASLCVNLPNREAVPLISETRFDVRKPTGPQR